MAEMQPIMSSQDLAELNRSVLEHNARLRSEYERIPQQTMGRDEFLKLLIAQLANQDPTAPLEDKEFIAQMAQFSTLEQMTSMSADFAKLTAMITGSEAASALGRNVEIINGESVVQGTVKAVTRGDAPTVLVNGEYYNWNQVRKVFDE